MIVLGFDDVHAIDDSTTYDEGCIPDPEGEEWAEYLEYLEYYDAILA